VCRLVGVRHAIAALVIHGWHFDMHAPLQPETAVSRKFEESFDEANYIHSGQFEPVLNFVFEA